MDNTLENRKIEIEHETLNNLNNIRKWAMFLAITGFIFLGLFIIIGIFAVIFFLTFNSGHSIIGISESYFFIIFLFLAAVYYLPVLFLFRFSKHTARAVHTLDKEELHKAFTNLKSYFVYLGVLIIIVLSVYIFVLIATGSSMALLNRA